MHSLKNEPLRYSFLSEEENFLVKKIVLTHDPDGRQIDSQMLLQAMENVMFYATMSSVYTSNLGAISEDKTSDDLHEALGQTIYTISQEILWNLPGDQDLQARTIMLFELLKNFSWDAKIVIVLAAFATSYGEFWLIIQLNPLNPLALSVATLKQLPKNLSAFKPRFKALNALVRSMVDVTKYVLEFEDLRAQQRKMDDKAIFTTQTEIFVASYWVIRSTLACSSLITDLISKNQENLSSTTTATWELSSLFSKMISICGNLQKQHVVWHSEIEHKVHQKLLKLFTEPNTDNQEALRTLFSLRDDMPLNGSYAQQKLGVSNLLNKVIILVISKPDLLPLDDLLFLLQQTCSFPDPDNLEKKYEIVWVPISSANRWSDNDKEVFSQLSNTMPWYSIRQPWLLTSPVVKFLQQVWNFLQEPMMVVLDPQGKTSSLNAISMVFTWGAMAYPFSVLREEQLWREMNWGLKLVMGEIDPLVSTLVEEGRVICLYGSDNLNWIREFTIKIKMIISTGVELELVYVGIKKPGRSINYILNSIAQEKLSGYLSFHDMHFFWLRLEHMLRSKFQIAILSDNDRIQKELESMMSHDDGWALFGKGNSSDTVQYHGTELMECLDHFPLWAPKIEKLGLLGSIARGFDPPPMEKICCQSNVVPYIEHPVEDRVLCEECKCPMEKFVLYQCQGTQ